MTHTVDSRCVASISEMYNDNHSMQPIKGGYCSVISPTITAESRTFRCLLSEPICCHIKDIQLKHLVSYIIKFSKIHKILTKNG